MNRDATDTRPVLISPERFAGPKPPQPASGLRLLAAGFSQAVDGDMAVAYYTALCRDVTPEQWAAVVYRAGRECKWFPKPFELLELADAVKQEILDRRALTAGERPNLPPVTEEEAAAALEILRKAARGQDPAAVVRPMPKAPRAGKRTHVDSAREEELRQRTREKLDEAMRRFGKANA